MIEDTINGPQTRNDSWLAFMMKGHLNGLTSHQNRRDSKIAGDIECQGHQKLNPWSKS